MFKQTKDFSRIALVSVLEALGVTVNKCTIGLFSRLRETWAGLRYVVFGVFLVVLILAGDCFNPQCSHAGISQSITFDMLLDRTYGDADVVPGATATSGLAVSYTSSDPSVATVVGDQIHIVGAGTTDITASQAGDATYDPAVDVVRSLTVSPATLTVTAENKSRTYGSANPALTVAYTGFVNGESESALATAPTATTTATTDSPVGDYPITVDGGVSANYTFTYIAGTLTVTKQSQTITFSTLPTTTYGDVDFAPGATASSGLIVSYVSSNPAVATIIGDQIHIVGAGTTDITATQSGDATYEAAPDVIQTLTVDKAAQSITFPAPAVGKIYGAADFSTIATSTSVLAVTYDSSDPAVATVNTSTGLVHILGAGSTTITANLAGDANYFPASAQTVLTVDKAVLTVTPQNVSRPYGTTNPAFTPVYSGFVNGDSAAALTGTPELTATATVASPVGSYLITAAIGTLAAANYTFSFGTGTLAVDLASQTITFNPLAPKTYGDASFDLTATGGASGNPVTYDSSDAAVATVSGGTVTIVGAGTAVITANQAGDANFASATAQQTLTVDRAVLTVTPQNASRPYGTTNPAFTPVYSGFVNGETSTVLTGAPELTTTATIASPAGSYPITSAIGTLTAANYTFSFGTGTLAVDLASQTISFDSLGTKTYGDASFDLTATGGASGNPVTYASSDPAVATVSGSTVTIVGAGSATITANQAGNANYASATAQQLLAVSKASLTVAVDNLSKTYGAANPVLTATYSGLVNGDTAAVVSGAPDLATSATPASPAGSYPITAAAGNLFSTNYSFSYTAGTLNINPAPLTVTADNRTKIYGAVNPLLTVSYSGFVNGDTAAALTTEPTTATTATTGSPAGSYPITASGGVSSNYTFTYVAGTLTVDMAAPTVTTWPTASAITYGQTLTSSTLSGGSASVAGSFAFTNPTAAPNAGTAAQSVVFTPTDTANYTTVTGSVNVTVEKANPTVTTWPIASAITYGQTLASSTLSGGSASVAGAFAFTTPAMAPNAGTAAQSVTFTPTDAANYTTATGSINVTVDKAVPTVTTWPSASAITYGQTLASSTLSGGSASVAGAFAFTTPATAPNAGTAAHGVTFTPTDAANYTAATGSVNVTVDKAVLTVTADAKTKTYGAANPPLTVSYSGFVNGDTAYSLTTQPTASTAATSGSPAGSYPITVSGGVSANYTFSYMAGTLTVSEQAQTITFNALADKTYGDADFSPGATASSGLTVTYSSSNPAVATIAGDQIHIVGAGTTDITARQAGDANFEAAADVVQLLTVDKAAQSITFTSPTVTKTYGEADFSTIATTASPLAVTYGSSDTAVATVNGTTGLVHIVGAGTANITANLAGDGNYYPALAQAVLTVDKAVLTVTPENASRPYGTDNPVFTAVYSGFVNGETSAVLTGAPELTTTATIASPAGSYSITAAIGTLAAANYTFSFVTGTLAVGLASQTITFNPLASKTYGDAPFDLTATGGASGNPVTFSSSDPAVATVSGATVTIVGAGSATITASQEGDTNYASATAQQTLTVNKAVLTVTPENASRPYGEANPAFTAAYSGFVNGETAAVLSGVSELTTTATIASPTGSYPITAAIGTLTAANYTFTFGTGTLAVGLASQTITFDPLATKTYGDVPFELTATGGGSGNPVTFTSSDPAVATVSGTTVTIVGAGTTTLTASQAGDANYASATAQQPLTVTKAPLTVTAANLNKIYGSVNPTLTASYSGFVNGETAAVLSGAPELTTTATIASPAGSYPITAAAGNLFSTNYSFSYTAGTLTIDLAPLTVTVDNKTKIYGAVNPPLTVSYSGFVNGDTAAALTTEPAAATTATTGSPVGSYPIIASGGISSNYTFTYVAGTLTVDKAAPTVTTWPSASAMTYGQTLASSTLSGGNASTAGAFAFTTPTAAPNAGTAAYSVIFTPTDTANYTTVIGSVNVTVDKANPTVTTWPSASTITYGQTLASSTLSGGSASVAGSFAFTNPTVAPNAGTAAQSATFTPTDGANYATVTGSVNVTIDKANPTVTSWPTATAITYGQTLASSTLSGGSASVAGAFAFTTLATAPNAGTAAQGVTFTPTDTANYTTVTGTVNVTVGKAVLTVTADAKAKTYGAANPPLTVSYSGFVNGDTVSSLTTQPTASTAATTGSPAGSYPITVNGGVSVNYTFSYAAGTLTIDKATLTVTADNQSKTYGAVNPALTVSYSGFVNGDTASSLTTQPMASTTATTGSPAGPYPITVSGGTSGNYSFVYVAGILTINPPTITVTSFTMPATATSLTVSVTNFTATDSLGVAGYLITESAAVPSAGDAGWTASAPASFTFGGYGSRIAYAWAKDAIGNVSASRSASVTINDVTPPTVTAFTLPATATSLTVAVTSFSATDNVGVTGYMITESATAPGPGDAGWNVSVPTTFTFGAYGSKTAYAWTKDAAGNVSTSASATVLVTGSASTLSVNGIASPRNAGTAASVTVTAKDVNGNTATTYRGTIRFTSSDPQAGLPSEYTFVAADNGIHTFDSAVTLKTAGTQSITATDIAMPAISGTQGGISVNPGTAYSLIPAGVTSPVTAGTASTVTVTVRDSFGNIATGYTGTIKFTSTDPQAVLPANYAFSAGDAGVHTFASQVVWKAAGIRSVTMSDTTVPALTGTITGITVHPAAASTLAVSGIASPRSADVPSTITVTALDSYGNVASGYRGTIHFTSTDSQAILPADYSFDAGDAGNHVFDFMVTLKSVGTQTVTATDTTSPTVTGVHPAVTVTPGVVASQSVKVAAGNAHTVALDTEGRVWTWGKNDVGQLGVGNTEDSATPVLVTGVSGIVSIAAGYNHTVALKHDGTVWSWGKNEYGQLGDGSNTIQLVPVQVANVSGVAAVAAGSYHTLALKADGTVVAWGRNAYGQLGDGTTVDRTRPVAVGGIVAVSALAAGANHTLLLTGSGDIWAMGANASGQLGNNYGDSKIPVRVSGLAGMKTVAAGFLHSLAVGNDGTLWTWGDNTSGQLGDGTTMNRYNPAKVVTLSDVVAVAGGGFHTLVLTDDGFLWSWGGNGNGQLGTGTTASASVPQQLPPLSGSTGIVALAAGGRHNAVAMGNGSLWTWGDNSAGQLGDGSTSYKTRVVPVDSLVDPATIEVGGNHTVALKTDGTVWTWGRNTFGQLGNGTLANRSVPGQVSGLTGMMAVAAGASHSAALKDDGTVWTWGANESGQLGDGTFAARSLPVQVQGLSGIIAISAGGYFTLALKSDGTVWAWGSNSSGQLGDDSTTNRAQPVQVTSLSGVSAISAGHLHSMALGGDGTVWTWGNNKFGQLGDESSIFRKIPVQAQISQAIAIAAGFNHSLALHSGGTVWAWGLNGYGQLGDGTNADRNVPVQITAIQGVTAIAAGSNHSLALLWDRSVWLWGDNFYGQLGNGTDVNENAPRQLPDSFDIRAIAAGGEDSVLVKNDGSVWTTGDNDSGQLGSGTPYTPAVVPSLLLGNDDIPPVTSASLAEGTYNGDQTVALSANEPAVIYYTIDGTNPTTGSLRYDSPISLTASSVVKFFAVDRAGNSEAVKTRNFTINPSYPLNLYLQGGGSGRIDLSTGGSCSGACSQSFLSGTTVDLTPVPAVGSVFMGWSGCDSVVGQTCRVTVSSARSVTANFDPSYTLAVTVVENGTISFSTGGSCTGNCSSLLRSGTTVELTASGGSTTVFERWSGCDSVNGASCSVTMTGPRSVSAVFGYLVMLANMAKDIHIQDAYNSGSLTDIISVRVAEFTENLNFNRPISVMLSGGYNSSFTNVIGQSTINGSLTISAGTVTVGNIVIR